MLSVGGGSTQSGKSPAARARGRRRPPACVAFMGSAPGGLPSLFLQQKPQNCQARALQGAQLGRANGSFALFSGTAFITITEPPTHTCTHTSNTCPRPKPRPLCELLGPRAPLLQMTAARCELPRQRYWKGYCCVLRERRQLYGSLQVDSALESGGCQSRGSRQL